MSSEACWSMLKFSFVPNDNDKDSFFFQSLTLKKAKGTIFQGITNSFCEVQNSK